MNFLLHVKEFCANFLFPKNPGILELETLTAEKLLETLPSAKHLKGAHIIALFDYSHPLVKKIIWELKYSGNRRIADKLGGIIYDVLQYELDDISLFESASWLSEEPILIPIPSSDKRRFERGWNQSELICKKILMHDQVGRFKYLPRQLIKIRHTDSQTKTSSKSERLANLTDSMRILEPTIVNGKCVIVIDDVVTTGATFAEARRALRLAGAKKILCVAIAH